MIELLYGTIFKPRETFRQVAENPPVFKSFLIFTGATIINLLTYFILLPHSVAKVPIAGIVIDTLQGMMPLLVIIGAVFAYISWFLMAALFHLFAEFFEGKGSAIGILCALGLIEIIKIVVLPLQVIGAVFEVGFISNFFTILSSVVYIVWWSILVVLGVREVQHLTTGKTLAVILSPIFFLALAAIVIVISGMGLLLPLFNLLGV